MCELYIPGRWRCGMIDIYGLIDPRTQRIKYIGQSIDCNQRLIQHMADTSETPKVKWITEIKSLGLKPLVVILDSAETRSDANYMENWWIICAKKQGWNLVNSTNPGEHRASFGDMFSAALQVMHKEYESSISRISDSYVSERISSERLLISQKVVDAISVIYISVSVIVAGFVIYWMFTGQKTEWNLFVGGMVWTLIFVTVSILIVTNRIEKWVK